MPEGMCERTLLAWKALEDAQRALQHLEGCSSENPSWRIFLVASLALLRTTGDVLTKHDKKASTAHGEEISSRWSELADKGNFPLLWSFMKKERDVLLHEYKTQAGWYQDNVVTTDGDTIRDNDGNTVIVEQLRYPEDRSLSFPGENILDLIRQSCSWWEAELTALEARISSRSKAQY